MKFKNGALGIGIAIVILLGISISQLEAQSTLTLQSLSERIDKAFQNIWELERQGNTTTSNLETHVTQSGDRGELDSTDTRPRKPVSGQKGTSES